MIEDLLLNVHRPAQYLGNEWNLVPKDFTQSKIRFALGFADLYEIGMSNLGLRIIYAVLNNIPDVVCERFFAPEPDMELVLKNTQRRLFSWESKQELKSFDFLGFSLGSELNYTNFLNILDLSGLPLIAAGRDEEYPLVIIGGPCVLNPEPLAEFCDLFVIGEAEEALVELMDLYRLYKDDYRQKRLSKEELLIKLVQVPGVYAPSLYQADYDVEGKLISFAPKFAGVPQRVKKRIVANFEEADFPCHWLVPYVPVTHDRVTLEIMRGCPNHCRFCQARAQYYPFRIRSKEKIAQYAALAYAATGYEDFSLAGLSVSDYPGLENLVQKIMEIFKDQAVNLSLPSLKAKALLGNVSTLIAKIKKTGLTFAPEAGSQRLREALAKDFQEEEFFQVIFEAYTAGYQHLKLYFLMGLPGEQIEDLQGIIDFAKKSSELRRKINGAPAQINISVNPLIPKPHTPLQWSGMESLSALKEKQNYLRNNCKNRRLKFNFHNLEMGFLEGVLSRGDRKLSRVILAAYQKGARFDAWSAHFSFNKWLEAFHETGVDAQSYLSAKSPKDLLAWDFIDMGISKDELLSEFEKFCALIFY